MPESKNVNTSSQKKKSTAVESVKAVAVLVSICLVCCILLAVCNDALYITDDERFQRSMSEIYPSFVKDTAFDDTLDATYSANGDYGEVKSVTKSTDGAYIVEALGNGGFKDGSVTLYVVVNADGTIASWAVKENVNQSYIGRVPSDAGTTWYVGKSVSDTLELEMTGATVVKTSTAINHAVNMAAYYCRKALKLGSDPEGDALAMLAQLLGDDYNSYTWQNAETLIKAKANATQTIAETLSDGTSVPDFVFRGTSDGGNVIAYLYDVSSESVQILVVDESGNVVSNMNIDDSQSFCTAALALRFVSVQFVNLTFTAALVNVDKTDTEAVYTVVGYPLSGYVPSSYTLRVSVALQGDVGQVSAIEAVSSGNYQISTTMTDALVTSLVGATSATIESLYTSGKVATATQSANIIAVAVKAALGQFDSDIAKE